MELFPNFPRNLEIEFELKAGQPVLGQNKIQTVLIHNLKTVWPTKISMPFLSQFLVQIASRFKNSLSMLILSQVYSYTLKTPEKSTKTPVPKPLYNAMIRSDLECSNHLWREITRHNIVSGRCPKTSYQIHHALS